MWGEWWLVAQWWLCHKVSCVCPSVAAGTEGTSRTHGPDGAAGPDGEWWKWGMELVGWNWGMEMMGWN